MSWLEDIRRRAYVRSQRRKRQRQEDQPYMTAFRVFCAMLGGHWPVINIWTNQRVCARCRQPLDKYGRALNR